MPNILDTIVDRKRQEVAELPPWKADADALRRVLSQRGGVRDFAGSLHHPPKGDIALIAEVKKASPSAGLIRPDFEPVGIACEYQTAGAACLSVLTDEKFFQGSLSYLADIRSAVQRPLLRKDFIIDPRQVLQAAQAGADAVLLIVAILSDARLSDLHALISESGLAALVEVHDEGELERALSIDARLIGVNNRNLKTFEVDLGTTEQLAKAMQSDIASGRRFLIAESGIHTRADVERLRDCGAGAILVGESLMRQDDIVSHARDLIGA